MYTISIKNINSKPRIVISRELFEKIDYVQLQGKNIEYVGSICNDEFVLEFSKDNTIEENSKNQLKELNFFDKDSNNLFVVLENKNQNTPLYLGKDIYGFVSGDEGKVYLKIVNLYYYSFLALPYRNISLKKHFRFIKPILFSSISKKKYNDIIAISFNSNIKLVYKEVHFQGTNILVDNLEIDNYFLCTDDYVIPIKIDKNYIVENAVSNFQIIIDSDDIEQKASVELNETIKSASYLTVKNINVEKATLNFSIDEKIENHLLCLRNRKTERLILIQGVANNNIVTYNFTDVFNEVSFDKEIWDFYIFSNYNTASYRIKADLSSTKTQFPYFENKSDFNSAYENRARLYITKNINVSLEVNTLNNLLKVKYNVTSSVDKLKIKKETISFIATLKSININKINVKDVLLVHRSKDNFHYKTITLKKKKYKFNEIKLHCVMSAKKNEFFPIYWDLYLLIENDENQDLIMKINSVSKNVKSVVNNSYFKNQIQLGNNQVFYPYITINNALAFMCREKEDYENRTFFLKENISFFISQLFKKRLYNKEIWVSFEKLASSAHDSSYYFFDFMMKNNKHKHMYYIIKKNSPEFENIAKYKKNILIFGSFKYFIYLFSARLLISSDTKRNSYNLKIKKTKMGRALENKPIVYLQHGVNGLKRVPDFHKNRNAFDLVVSPSNFETELIVNQWGYKSKEVITTGLARWDGLIDKAPLNDVKEVFIMPTWRTWMDGMTDEMFKETEYFQSYNNLLNTNDLHTLLERYNLKINFFLHPKFKSYIDLFDVKHDKINKFSFLDVSIDEKIMQSSLMITDYSSIIWDMFYLKKPCIFFQFDKEKYLKIEGSYMDFETELFGDAAETTDKVIGLIEEYAKDNFKEKAIFGSMRKRYFTFQDKENSDRIYTEIENHKHILYKKDRLKKFKITHLLPFKLRNKILTFIEKNKF